MIEALAHCAKKRPAAKILVLGESGVGKSSSFRNLTSPSTVLLNTEAKEMPFAANIDNYVIDDFQQASYALGVMLHESSVKTILIDSYSSLHNMLLSQCKSQNTSRNGFSDYGMLKTISSEFLNSVARMQKNVILTCVTSKADGQMLPSIDGKIKETLCSFFTVVLYAKIIEVNDKPVHCFETINYGDNLSKSPAGMFSGLVTEFNSAHGVDLTVIDNDMAKVLKAYYDFYKKS